MPIYHKSKQLWALIRQPETTALRNQKQKLRRELLFLLEPEQCHFANFAQFSQAIIPHGRFSVAMDGLRFDCMFAPQKGEHLFVVLSGLRTPNRHPIPKFDRLTFTHLFPGSVLYISDPCHYLPAGPQTAWYLGTESIDGLNGLTQITQHVAQSLGLSSKQVISYGSSAGGFAAMQLAARLKNATAVAINTQTHLWQIQPARLFTNFVEKCFPNKNNPSVLAQGDPQFNAIVAIESSPDMRCLYVQNTQDFFHFKQYFVPLCAHFKLDASLARDRAGPIESLVYEHASGHGGEPREIAPDIIRRAMALADE